MLSNEEKREMLADAKNEERRKDFASARQWLEVRKLTGEEYIHFLTSTAKVFSKPRIFKRIEGRFFKL